MNFLVSLIFSSILSIIFWYTLSWPNYIGQAVFVIMILIYDSHYHLSKKIENINKPKVF
jgi:hypothetical protein